MIENMSRQVMSFYKIAVKRIKAVARTSGIRVFHFQRT